MFTRVIYFQSPKTPLLPKLSDYPHWAAQYELYTIYEASVGLCVVLRGLPLELAFHDPLLAEAVVTVAQQGRRRTARVWLL